LPKIEALAKADIGEKHRCALLPPYSIKTFPTALKAFNIAAIPMFHVEHYCFHMLFKNKKDIINSVYAFFN